MWFKCNNERKRVEFKSMYNRILSGFLAMLLCACNNVKDDKNNAPDLDMVNSKEISFDDWVTDVACFRLNESGTNFYFKIIDYDAFFYLYSFEGVSVFKKSGEHVRTITSRPFPNDIFVNEKEKQLWVLEPLEFIKKYSLDGQFIEQIQLPFKAAKIAPAGTNRFLFFEGVYDKSSPSFLRLVSDVDFSTQAAFVPKYHINNTIPVSTFAYNSYETFIYLPYNDTIYVFDNTNLDVTPKWRLHFSGNFLTHHDIPEGGFSDKRYAEIMKENTKYRGLCGVHCINQFLFLRLEGKDNSFRAIDITTDNAYRFNALVDNLTISPQGSTTDGLLVVMTTQEFIRHYSNPANHTKYESVKDILAKVNERDSGLIVLKIILKKALP